MSQPISVRLAGRDWVDAILCGIGQIIFQDNRWSGLLFLGGVASAGIYSPQSFWMATAGALGSFLGALLAQIAGRSRESITSGLHGFNPALVGMVVFAWFEPNLYSGLFFLLGAALAWALTESIRLTPIPGYTAPFILVSWAIHFASRFVWVVPTQGVREPASLQVADALLEGMSEIMLIGGSPWPGLLFLAGIAVGNRWHAVLAILASVVGLLMVLFYGDPVDKVNLGLFGYNAVLAMIAMYLAGKGIYGALCGAFLSVILTEVFGHTTIPTLTAPFVLAVWLLLPFGKIEGMPKYGAAIS